MICGMGSKTGLLAKKGGAADVTPDPVTWGSIFSPTFEATSSTRTITGINTTIILQINISNNRSCSSGSPAYSYSKNSSNFVTILNNGTINIVNNDTLQFRFINCRINQSATFTITNNSDGNSVLDIFTLYTDSI